MNRAQLILIGAVGVLVLIVFLVLFGVIPGLQPATPKKITLTVWGLEDVEPWQALAVRFTGQYPNMALLYVKKNPATYEQELLNALAAGSGPDVFLLKNGQIQKYKDKIFPLPRGVFTFQARDFQNRFFDAASRDLIDKEGNILGFPVAVDPLALFYNRDALNAANISSPPATWDALVEATKRLTRLSEVGAIVRAGIALGTSANVEHATDILGALMIQSGVELVDRQTLVSDLLSGETRFGSEDPAVAALRFYTSFADPSLRTYSWSAFFPDSLDAFAQGMAAMMIGYASDVPRIQKKNPHLSFGVSRFPQTNGRDSVYVGRFSLGAVSRQSQHSYDAWRLLFWLSGRENAKFLAGSFGLAPARRDLVNEVPDKEYASVFYEQVLAGRTWLIPDEAIVQQLFQEAIDSVVNRAATPEAAIGRAHQRLNQALKMTQ